MPWGCPLLRDRDLALFQNAGLQPFADQANDTPIGDPVFHEADQPVLAEAVEKPGNVGVQDPVHLAHRDPGRERIQRVVLAAPRPEPVAEPEEALTRSRR